MEGLILEVKADISQFETALTRLQTLTDGALFGFNDSLRGLGDAVASATAGMEGFSALIKEQDQSWISTGNALAVCNTGLVRIKTGMAGLAELTAKAVAQVKELKASLEALPKQVIIEIILKKSGSIPKFHQGGFIAGPALSPPLAHGGMYISPPGPEERDVRVLTGEYILSRKGVRNLGLAALRAADKGRSGDDTAAAGQPAKIENHYHIDTLVRVGGSMVADEATLIDFAERIGRELDWQAQGRTS